MSAEIFISYKEFANLAEAKRPFSRFRAKTTNKYQQVIDFVVDFSLNWHGDGEEIEVCVHDFQINFVKD